MRQTEQTVVIINCGYHDVQKLARKIRDHHIYTMVMPFTVPTERLLQEKPVGLIFAGSEVSDLAKAELPRLANAGIPAYAAGDVSAFLPGVPAGKLDDVDMILDFCKNTCGCTGAWTLDTFVDDAVREVRELVGNEKVVLGLSGGVDSSVVAALLHKAIGDQLTCVFVNHGLLRKNEAENVQELFAGHFKMNLKYVDASDRFLDKLAGVSDPEQKRKIIGKEFIDVFAEAARETDATFLGQGTIYPDILESISFDGKPEGVIKSHHNVGGLPPDLKFKLVEPVDRHPFPGPSLGVRHIGPIARPTLKMLQEADAIVTEELIKAGWYHKTWQTFAIFVPVKTVGIKDGKRSYDNVIAIRSINSVDAVTADVVELPWELLFKMSTRIVKEVDGINRVVYDITGKPPATIEWE